MVTKLFEVKLGENGCVLRVIEGGDGLSLTRGQINRAVVEGDSEGIPLYLYQEVEGKTEAWIAFLKLLNEEFGPDPGAIVIGSSEEQIV